MTSLTVRNIPDDVIDKIKTLAVAERRSINNEMVLLIEKGLENHIKISASKDEKMVSKETQLYVWKDISKNWIDNRSSKEMIKDIYSTRSIGRDIEL